MNDNSQIDSSEKWLKTISPLGYPSQLIAPGESFESVTEEISSIVLQPRQPRSWWFGAAVAFALLMLFFFAISYLLYRGVGIWGINIPVAWGFAIVNFVWWIGIGHAGTFISAILLLLHQKWRTSINRLTEAMTLFAVACAGIFPLLHLGRPLVFYWLFPYPDTMGLWPQFRSPLVWDVFAVSTYFTVSLIFWYVGLIPDLGNACATAHKLAEKKSSMESLRSAGAVRPNTGKTINRPICSWPDLPRRWCLSVHSVVSFDFSVAMVPGWHSTIFPPYFVAGAIYSGFAMVLNIMIPIRKLYGLKNLITERHLNNMAVVMLATGMMVAYGYVMEAFMSWYSGDIFEQYMMTNRAFGPYGWIFWALMLLNVLIPQLLWSRRVRTIRSRCFLSHFPSTSECGSNASSLSSSVCTAISRRPRGECIARRFGIGQRCSAASDYF